MTKNEILKYMFYESIDRETETIIKPRYMYYVHYYRTALDKAEVQDVCINTINYLFSKYDNINKSLIGMTIHNKLKNRIRDNKRKKSKEVLTLDTNDNHNRPLYTTIAATAETESPTVSWKEPLNDREQLYADLLSKGILSKVIAKEYNIPTKEQEALKMALKRKIQIGGI